jgi:hypothetical protein
MMMMIKWEGAETYKNERDRPDGRIILSLISKI